MKRSVPEQERLAAGGQPESTVGLPLKAMSGAVPSVDVVRQLLSAGEHVMARFFPHGVMFAFDRNLRYLSVDGLALAAVGLSRELMEGRTIFEIFPPETCTVIEPLYRAVLDGDVSTVDVAYGGRIFNQRLAPAVDSEGVVVAGLGFSEDVTDTRAAERTLRESEMRMRLTIDNAPIGEALVELDGRWRAVNPALLALLGYSEAQLVELTFQDITHPDDLDLDLDLLNRLVNGEIASYEMEKRYFTAVGTLVWVLLSVSLVRDSDGEPLYFVSQILDITERKRQEESLKDLTAMLSHDLRAPITVVAGFAEVMISEWDHVGDDQRLDAFRRIESAARSMRGLLENSLTASTLDGQGLRADPTAVDLAVAVREVLETVPHLGVEVRAEGLDGIEIWLDGNHFAQVLSNLITNAVKYGGDQLVLHSERRGDRQLLTVTDNGPGVPATFVPHLFDRFSRADSARKGPQRGSGLGLHIVRDLLKLNDATIEYADAEHGGAAFVLDLPRRMSSDVE